MMQTGASPPLKKSEISANTASPVATRFTIAETLGATGPATALGKAEVTSIAEAEAPTSPAELRVRTEEILGGNEAMAAPPSLASATKKTTVPATHQITTAATYELDRLESEGIDD
ncbi:hypothetical protein JD844_020365 [Phrynosoma platyrhinos]|uniref:Uncharacterized protein n=1 Tax=Phrynosoma platyrhinos TaxID=52577 RepID=A0ABQ7ST69_PHRPL|nr:hypothetical protein JD844_020365 [Phrynosoma platyrhinos]